MNSTTTTTTISWGSRLGSSFKGIVVGLVMFILGFPILFWNEGRAVDATKTNEEGASNVVEADAATVDPAQDGKLVHVIGEATTEDVLKDDTYGVAEKAIALRRKVEMYQWVEHEETREEKKLGGKIERTTTYTYAKEWCDAPVSSDTFHVQQPTQVNPPARCELGRSELRATTVALGARRLAEGQIRRIGGWTGLKSLYEPVTTNEFFEISGTVPEPKVGDVRVTFEIVKAPRTITVVAGQRGNTFMAYTAKSTGSSIDHLLDGAVDAAGVFARAEKGNSIMTWILRLVGFIIMYLGVSKIFAPLSVLADVVPAIGSIVSFGTGILSFLIAAPCALATIAVAWVFYRPVLGISLLAIAGALVGFAIYKVATGKKAA